MSRRNQEDYRPRTVGADFDARHYVLFKDYCDMADIDGATLIRKIMYPVLDEYEQTRKTAIRAAMGFIHE